MNSKPKPQVKKVVLAYSGGLDTSVIVPWLKENYGCEVVCFCADVGQGDEDMRGLEKKALNSGASQCIIHDMKEEFASEYLFPLLKAGAVYEHKYLLGTSVARPLIAKHLVDVAHEVGADAIAVAVITAFLVNHFVAIAEIAVQLDFFDPLEGFRQGHCAGFLEFGHRCALLFLSGFQFDQFALHLPHLFVLLFHLQAKLADLVG